MWAAYARAMRAEPNPDSPFASPRAPEADGRLIWDLAELVAGSPSTGSRGSSGTGSSSSNNNVTLNSGKRASSGRTTTVQPHKLTASPAPAAAPQAGEEHGDASGAGVNAGTGVPAGRRWRLRGFAKNLAGAFGASGSKGK